MSKVKINVYQSYKVHVQVTVCRLNVSLIPVVQ